MNAARVLRRAVENQVKGLGFSFVEVLSPCPTIWKMNPVEAQTFVREEMAATFGVASYRDRSKQALARPEPPTPPPGRPAADSGTLERATHRRVRHPHPGTGSAYQSGGLRRARCPDAR